MLGQLTITDIMAKFWIFAENFDKSCSLRILRILWNFYMAIE